MTETRSIHIRTAMDMTLPVRMWPSRVPGLVVTETQPKSGMYHVTHVESGRTVDKYDIPSVEAALILADRLGALDIDWELPLAEFFSRYQDRETQVVGIARAFVQELEENPHILLT